MEKEKNKGIISIIIGILALIPLIIYYVSENVGIDNRTVGITASSLLAAFLSIYNGYSMLKK